MALLKRNGYFRVVFPHSIIIFTFSSYIFLGACGLYFLIFPSMPDQEYWNVYDDLDSVPMLDGPWMDPMDYIELNIDIPCSEAKRRLEEMQKREYEASRSSNRDQLKKFTFDRAVLICFNWITTIGNRWPEEWEYVESEPSERESSKGKGGTIFNKFYALSYMLLGIPLAFVTFSIFSALLYDALNIAFFTIRRKWHSKMIGTRSEQISRDFEESRLWNPLWFMIILISYLVCGAFLLKYIWFKSYETPITFTDALWNCAALIFGIGETTSDIFVLPSGGLYCFGQICYTVFGLIIFGAFLRSFLPLATRIYQPNPYRLKNRSPIDQTRSESKERVSLLDEGGFVRRTPPIHSRMKRGPAMVAASADHIPRSILRQRNGAFSFEPKCNDSLDSVKSEDWALSPSVRFVEPSEGTSRTVAGSNGETVWREKGPDRAAQTRMGGDPVETMRGEKAHLRLTQPGSFTDVHGSRVFKVSPESFPYADERASALIT